MMVRRLISEDDIEDLQNAYIILDVDNDGFLSIDELKNADHILGDLALGDRWKDVL